MPVKVNAVIKRGLNEHSILQMAAHFRGTGHTLRFIEYMDVGTTNGWRLDDVVPAARDRRARSPPSSRSSRSTRATAARSPSAGATADGGGEIGVISSVTQPFCGDCTRSRISAEGRLYTCLFARPRARPARAASPRRVRRGAGRRGRRDLGRAHRPLLRAALRGDRHAAESGDELHRRLSTPAASSGAMPRALRPRGVESAVR